MIILMLICQWYLYPDEKLWRIYKWGGRILQATDWSLGNWLPQRLYCSPQVCDLITVRHVTYWVFVQFCENFSLEFRNIEVIFSYWISYVLIMKRNVWSNILQHSNTDWKLVPKVAQYPNSDMTDHQAS